jgi:hypothetical protein
MWAGLVLGVLTLAAHHESRPPSLIRRDKAWFTVTDGVAGFRRPRMLSQWLRVDRATRDDRIPSSHGANDGHETTDQQGVHREIQEQSHHSYDIHRRQGHAIAVPRLSGRGFAPRGTCPPNRPTHRRRDRERRFPKRGGGHRTSRRRYGQTPEGLWRLRPEHAAIKMEKQGSPLLPYETSNPEHVFEIHPVTRINDTDLWDSFRPVEGFKPGGRSEPLGSMKEPPAGSRSNQRRFRYSRRPGSTTTSSLSWNSPMTASWWWPTGGL